MLRSNDKEKKDTDGLRTVIIILFAVFVMPIILAPSVSIFAQDENCCKGRSIGYIIDKSGKKICGQIVLHSSLIGGEVWKDQFVISFSPQEKVEKDWAKAKAREEKGKSYKNLREFLKNSRKSLLSASLCIRFQF